VITGRKNGSVARITTQVIPGILNVNHNEKKLLNRLNFKWRHFEKEIILINVRCYLAYPSSYRHLEEMTEERGYRVDHNTISLWVIKYSSELEQEFQQKNETNQFALANG